MNVLFLTIAGLNEISSRGIYQDLMRTFRDKGHSVFIASPSERRYGLSTRIYEVDGVKILKVWTLNILETNILEKGLGTLLIEYQFKHALKKHLGQEHFDLILYSTPPITFPKVINFIKRRNPNAKTYLLLKDIFPQNAIDIGLMTKRGIKGLLYKYFRSKEKKLYQLSDYIGCMSPANVDYILRHNPEVKHNCIEVAPNSVELCEDGMGLIDRDKIRKKYGLPMDKPIFIYGGNLGKPQGIPFLIECLEANSDRDDCHFMVIGKGTELPRLQKWYEQTKPNNPNVTVMEGLPKADYDNLVRACDVGLIFLDHRFTIPNYPSRLLSYLENKMPILCATDPNTDIGRIAEENSYGYWCESNSAEAFTKVLDKMILSDRQKMGENGYKYLCKNYLVENTYSTIISHV